MVTDCQPGGRELVPSGPRLFSVVNNSLDSSRGGEQSSFRKADDRIRVCFDFHGGFSPQLHSPERPNRTKVPKG